MNHILQLVQKGEKIVRTNSPTILTALGVSGAVSTAYLTGKASWEAQYVIDHKMTTREKFEAAWTLYIPPAISGMITVACIIGANRVSSRRAAAAYSLVALSEKTFEEYREKVIEKLGDRKEQAVREEIVQDRVTANKPGAVILGSGSVLCCETHTMRYFMSDMEALRRAENDINSRLVRELYVTLDDFYYILGLEYTTTSGSQGWNSDKLLKLEYTAVLADDNRPCIAFDYNYLKAL